MANAIQANNSDILAKHQASIAASLAHRLEVARANQNAQLIALLEREQQQLLGSNPNGLVSSINWLKRTWQSVVEAIANSSKLTVERIQDESGTIWWYAHDPRTGKTLYAETEADVLQWIESNRLGENV